MRPHPILGRIVLLVLVITIAVVMWEETRTFGSAKSARPASTTSQCHAVAGDVTSPLVCSHKGYHRAYNAPREHHLFPPMLGSGLLRSVGWLATRMGIRCFDLDLTLTRDGVAVVGHPTDLKRVLKLKSSAADHTLAQLQRRDSSLSPHPAPGRSSVVTLHEFLPAAAALGITQLTLEPKNFTSPALDALAAVLSKHVASFRGSSRGSGAGLVMIVDHIKVATAARLELSKQVPLAVGVRETAYGGDESIYCGGVERVPDHVSHVMPSIKVVSGCPTERLRGKGVAVWNIASPEDARVVSKQADAVITDYPALVAHHCGMVSWKGSDPPKS